MTGLGLSHRDRLPAGVDRRRTRTTAFGLYRLTLHPAGADRPWLVIVRDARRRPQAAHVRATCGAPRTGVRLPVDEVVSGPDGRAHLRHVPQGDGRWWVVHVAVDGPGGADSVSFNVIASPRRPWTAWPVGSCWVRPLQFVA